MCKPKAQVQAEKWSSQIRAGPGEPLTTRPTSRYGPFSVQWAVAVPGGSGSEFMKVIPAPTVMMPRG
jgi:hypothetical protein